MLPVKARRGLNSCAACLLSFVPFATSAQMATLPAMGAAQEVEVEVDATVVLSPGMPVQTAIKICNLDVQARDFTCYVHVLAVAQNGNEIGVVSGPVTHPLTIEAGGASVVTSNVTWNQVRPFFGRTEFIEVLVVVTRVHDDRHWFKERTIVIDDLPVTVTLTPSGQVHPSACVVAKVTFSNPLAEPLNASVLTLRGYSGLLINGATRSEEIQVAPLAPGETIVLTRLLVASRLGHQAFSAHWLVPGTAPGHSSASIKVVEPGPGDADGSGVANFDNLTAVLANFGTVGAP